MSNQVGINYFGFSAELSQRDTRRKTFAFLVRGLSIGVVVLGTHLFSTVAAQSIPSTAKPDSETATLETNPAPSRTANFGKETSSAESQKFAAWVMDSADNGKLPFVIIDKMNARAFVFDAQGQLKGASSVLLGLAVGDDSVPGIGQRKLSSIRPAERTTPAGRFVASLDRDIHGSEVLWVDYETAVSLHRVATGQPKERRVERLASSSLVDKRISYGCINVPVKFYENIVSPTFTGTSGIVYILPETRSAKAVFGSYDVLDSPRKQIALDSTQAGNGTTK